MFDADTRARKESALKTLLNQFDVPGMVRQDPATPRNLGWLKRNLAIENGSNPMLDTTQELVRQLLRDNIRRGHARKGDPKFLEEKV